MGLFNFFENGLTPGLADHLILLVWGFLYSACVLTVPLSQEQCAAPTYIPRNSFQFAVLFH